MNLQTRFVQAHGLQFHVAEIGDPQAPLILMLHGFPEFWYSWRNHMVALAEAGFYVVAPDQRGYNLSDKPADIAAYNLDLLATDVTELIKALGHSKAHLVGHDWGSIVAWWVAHKYPECIDRMVIMNAPHPLVMEHALRHNFAQLKRSWYFLAFQLPWLPEKILEGKDYENFALALNEDIKRNALLPSDLEKYKTAWRQPGCLTGMINWYRAALRYKPTPPPPSKIKVPTLVLWGARDPYLGKELAAESMALCENGRIVWFDNAGHFVQHDAAEEISEEMLAFFQQP